MSTKYIAISLVCFLFLPEMTLGSGVLTGLFLDTSESLDFEEPVVGTILTTENIDRYIDIVEPLTASLIREGQLTVIVGKTFEFPVHKGYLQATETYSTSVRLGDEPGVINNYVAGRPFPNLNAKDPAAGIKAAWNMRYAYSPDESELSQFHWQYRDMVTGKIERNLEMSARMLRYTHRHTKEPMPSLPKNTAGIFHALYLRVEKPLDIRNTQLLIYRLEDDTKKEQAWMYTATQRRVRRLASGQMTDAFLGSDIMIEDFLGFNGRIKDMDWNYRESAWLLMPLYKQSSSGTRDSSDTPEMVKFHGQGNCFPNVTWQMRKVHILDAIPKSESHPISRRTFYIDAQGFGPALIKIFDRAGKVWKLGIAAVSDSRHHLPSNNEWQGGIVEAFSMIDLQARHCTTLQMLPVIPSKGLKTQQFTVQFLRSNGR